MNRGAADVCRTVANHNRFQRLYLCVNGKAERFTAAVRGRMHTSVPLVSHPYTRSSKKHCPDSEELS